MFNIRKKDTLDLTVSVTEVERDQGLDTKLNGRRHFLDNGYE